MSPGAERARRCTPTPSGTPPLTANESWGGARSKTPRSITCRRRRKSRPSSVWRGWSGELWRLRRRLPRWFHAGEIARTVRYGDDLHGLLIANAVDDAIRLKEDFSNRILVTGFRDGTAAARQEGQALNGEHHALGELACIEGRILRDVVAQLREFPLGAR